MLLKSCALCYFYTRRWEGWFPTTGLQAFDRNEWSPLSLPIWAEDWQSSFCLFYFILHNTSFQKVFASAASPGEIKSSFRCITSISIAHAQFLNVCPTVRLSLHLRFNRHYASSVSGQRGHKMHRIRFRGRHQIGKSRPLCLDYLSGQNSWSNQLISNSQVIHFLKCAFILYCLLLSFSVMISHAKGIYWSRRHGERCCYHSVMVFQQHKETRVWAQMMTPQADRLGSMCYFGMK